VKSEGKKRDSYSRAFHRSHSPFQRKKSKKKGGKKEKGPPFKYTSNWRKKTQRGRKRGGDVNDRRENYVMFPQKAKGAGEIIMEPSP